MAEVSRGGPLTPWNWSPGNAGGFHCRTHFARSGPAPARLPALPLPGIFGNLPAPGTSCEWEKGPRRGSHFRLKPVGRGERREAVVAPESAEKEGRKALNRLRRAVEKSLRELDGLERAIRYAEGEDFPVRDYDAARDRLRAVEDFLEEEGRRLEAKLLETGGLEPGRIRRGSS